jgi:hypothetical protein
MMGNQENARRDKSGVKKEVLLGLHFKTGGDHALNVDHYMRPSHNDCSG